MATRQGSSQSPSSDYVYVGTPEETLLETYFVMLAKFNFDKAKEQCDWERESKSSGSWGDFMSILSRLANNEMSYWGLSFVGRSWIVRKESLKATYESLAQDLRKIKEVYHHRKGGTDLSWERKMEELTISVVEYVGARRDMIDFYLTIEFPDGSHIDYSKYEARLKELQQRYRESFQHSYLKPVRKSFESETGVVLDLLKAQQLLAAWQFLPAMLSVQASYNKLATWAGLVPPTLQTSTSTPHFTSIRAQPLSPTYLLSLPPAALPSLYQWFCAFYYALLSKFTLYFSDLLTENGAMSDAKHLSNKLETDYIQCFSQLVKHTYTICVCLVFDSTGVEGFRGPAYQCPGSPAMQLTGLNSYPIMVSVPQGFDMFPHRANIVSVIMTMRGPTPTILTQHDSKLSCTYYLSQVEHRVTLVLIVHQHRAKERNIIVITKMNELANKLRNYHIIHTLRASSF